MNESPHPQAQRCASMLQRLFQAACEQSAERFRGTALHELRELIGFDQAWWACGCHRPDSGRRVVRLAEADRDTRCQGGSRIALALDEDGSPSGGDLILWRREAAFGDGARHWLRLLAPSLRRAWHLNLSLQVQALRREGAAGGWAVCDDLGVIRLSSPAFAAMLRAEWPRAPSCRLPEAALRSVDARIRFRGLQCVFEPSRGTDLRLIEGVWHSELDALSERERQVCSLYAGGLTHVRIAERLRTSPSTVRNQIYRSFAKLRISNKAELVHRLHRLPASGSAS